MESSGQILLRFRRHRAAVFGLLFTAYVGYYFGRVTVPTALPVLEGAFAFTKTETGLILSGYYAVYALSKAVNGVLGDRAGGKALLLVGIAGSVACNVAFGFGRELWVFVAIWGANAYFQSMGWLGLVPIMSRWYTSQESGRAMGVMSLSYQLGDFAARSFAGLVIATLAWRGLFWVHAAVLGLVGVAVLTKLRPSPAALGLPPGEVYGRGAAGSGLPPIPAASATVAPEPAGLEYRQWVRRMLSSPWFWTVCLVYLLLSILRYVFWGWSVQYLIDTGGRIGTAAVTAAVFPLVGSLGTIFAGWVSDRMQARRGPVMVVMVACLSLAIYGFSRIPAERPLALVGALGLVGFCLYGPYALMAGAVAIDFGSTRASATAAGLIDAVGAVGAILTGVGMGFLIDAYGWNSAFNLVVSLAVLATLFTLTLWNMRPLAASIRGLEESRA